MTNYYQKNIDEILNELHSSEKGLSKSVALEKLKIDGNNELDPVKKRNIFLKLLDQFNDFMIIILLIAAGIALFFAVINKSNDELVEAFLILAIVVINALLGLFQEIRSEKALEEIMSLSSPHILVLRDNKEELIETKHLVVGDIVLLKTGDIIPADLRLISTNNLLVDESILTGESLSVSKHNNPINDVVSLGDQKNLCFMNTVVTKGTGIGIVVKTAMDTEIGKISKLLSETKSKETPLQRDIATLAKKLVYIIFAIVVLIFMIQIIRDLILGNINIIPTLMISITLAVAAIPEGLPAIITIILSLGMQRLVKKGAILRTLPAVETLGSTSIICTDKTGTLTQNKMSIEKLYFYKDKVNLDKFVIYSTLGNNATLIKTDDGNLVPTGDPTAKAFLDYAIKNDYDVVNIIGNSPKVFELPFDSERKLNTSIHRINDKLISITIGAPDVITNKLSFVDNDEIISINNKIIDDILEQNKLYAKDAYRVVGISYKELPNDFDLNNIDLELLENDLTFLSLAAMSDPIKEEVIETIIQTKKAGIKMIMITGDHKNTAISIAKQLNILGDDELAITGLELDKLSDNEYMDVIKRITVYARVSPENKVRIVKGWQNLGFVVAMTGDGVNDAPSLKAADIGIAMGEGGTEVAKNASDLILTDDNFTTIVDTVFEGRTIFKNLKNVIKFLLSSNIGELLIIIFGIIFGIFAFPNDTHLQILSASQILWVNLVTDAFVAMGIGLEPKDPTIMDELPRDTKKEIFSKKEWKNLFLSGLMIGSLSFIAFVVGFYKGDLPLAQTLAFMVLSLSQLVHAFNFRNDKISIFKLKINKILIYTFIISFVLQMLTISIPFLADNVFRTVSIINLDIYDFLLISGLSILPLLIFESIKFYRRKN